MGTTPTLLLPYPEPTDPADVPTDMNELATRIETVRGAANGLASLDSGGKVPVAQIPTIATSYVSPELAYAQVTAAKTISGTVDSVADLVVAAPAVTLDGTTAVIVEVYAPAMTPPNVQGAFIRVILFQDGVSIGVLGQATAWAAIAAAYGPVSARRKLTPAAGSRQFSFAATVSGATGTVHAGGGGAGAYLPAFIRVSRA